MKLFTMIALLLLIFATSNCALIGLEEEEEETETAETETAETGSIDDLQGTWEATACPDGASILLVISGKNLTYTGTLYGGPGSNDTTCNTPAYSYSYSLTDLVRGEKAFLTDGTEGYSLSSNLQYYRMTPHIDDITDILNSTNTCGIDSWKTNETSDCTGKDAFGDPLPESGTAYSQRYRVSGNKLYYEEKLREDEEWDFMAVYTKQ